VVHAKLLPVFMCLVTNIPLEGKRYEVGMYTEQFYAIIPTLFPWFLLICYLSCKGRKSAEAEGEV